MANLLSLIINRFQSDVQDYKFAFNIHEDITIYEGVLAFRWQGIVMHPTKELIESDKLLTSSIDIKFVILNVQHPIIQSNYILNQYWKIRLKYGKKPCSLIEYGKRLF